MHKKTRRTSYSNTVENRQKSLLRKIQARSAANTIINNDTLPATSSPPTSSLTWLCSEHDKRLRAARGLPLASCLLTRARQLARCRTASILLEIRRHEQKVYRFEVTSFSYCCMH